MKLVLLFALHGKLLAALLVVLRAAVTALALVAGVLAALRAAGLVL